jgi:hypothetical protein
MYAVFFLLVELNAKSPTAMNKFKLACGNEKQKSSACPH